VPTKLLQEADFKLGVTNKSAEFLKQFPFGKVPAFVSAEGHALYETSAIAQFVAGDALATSCKYEAALVQQYISLAESEVYPASCTWVYPTFGAIQFNKTVCHRWMIGFVSTLVQATARAQEDVKRILGVLNVVLETRTFLVGEKITLADITLATAFLQLYQNVLDVAFRAPFPHVNRWFVTLVNQPQFKVLPVFPFISSRSHCLGCPW
jgi:elongation factor 1-gamma